MPDATFKQLVKAYGYAAVKGALDEDVRRAERRDRQYAAARWGRARILSCRCRSVWCQHCATMSPTNAAVGARIAALNWRQVRHIVLTVDRAGAPDTAFEEIRRNRAVAKTMKQLGAFRWVCVLEFHRGGWPHWHVLAEAGGMLGHKRIAAAWDRGLVWESYVKNEHHWRAICGYHRTKGYLAGEAKAHQLELPDYLKSESRVRKFSSNFTLLGGNVPRGTLKRGKRRDSKSYSERFEACDKQTRLIFEGREYLIDGSCKENRERLARLLHKEDFMHFSGERRRLIAIADELSGAGVSDQSHIVD